MIPALEQIIKRGGALGVKEIVIGMAHRGRLNVLAQVMGKPHRAIFHEFKGGSVDARRRRRLRRREVSPRRLVGPRVRRQHRCICRSPPTRRISRSSIRWCSARCAPSRTSTARRREDRTMVMPLLIHGDAAFAGQGVVAECFGLSGLRGHRTGGSIHFIVNNQIGFTTYPRYSRSSPYPSDVAKMIEAPIFHVNGDDPEAVVYAAKVATEFRQKFQKPVVIDMFCYRRFGHNEGDEPAFTQPLMYKKIRAHPIDARDLRQEAGRRGRRHRGRGREDAGRLARAARRRVRGEPGLQAEQGRLARRPLGRPEGRRRERRSAPRRHRRRDRDAARRSARRSPRCRRASTSTAPSSASSTTARKAIETGEGIDWATAEALAFGSLLLEGHPVRLSGQDGERGTFSQRHSVLIDQENEERYTPLNHLARRAGALRGHQLDALGRGGARLRVRLLARRAERADAVGGAVRRLRQRRAGACSTSSSRRASASGCACPASSACCRTATRARGRSIPRRGSSASCRCAPRTTCRSPTARRRRTTSTSCAGS